MSRIGRLPIAVPSGVDVTIEGRKVTVKGPKGELSRELHPDMKVSREDDQIVVTRPTEQKTHKQLHGLTRTLVNNMVVGVTDGYRKGLEITGVGYRAVKVGEKLQLSLGYSHQIEIDPPQGHHVRAREPDPPRGRRDRQGARRRDRRKGPLDPQARAVQGQGRSLRRRADPSKGRQGRQDRRQEVVQAIAKMARHGKAAPSTRSERTQTCVSEGRRRQRSHDLPAKAT